MGAFEYTALDIAGKERKGVLEGDNARAVRQALREREKDLPWPAVLRYAWQEAQAGFAALIEVVVEGGHA